MKSTHFVLKQKDYLHISKKNAIFAAKIEDIVPKIKINIILGQDNGNIFDIVRVGRNVS